MSLEKVLSPEVWEQILLHADYETTINLCRTCHNLYNFYLDFTFWKRKALIKLNIPFDEFENTLLIGVKRYNQLQIQKRNQDLFNYVRSLNSTNFWGDLSLSQNPNKQLLEYLTK